MLKIAYAKMPNHGNIYKSGRAQLDVQYTSRSEKLLARTRLALSRDKESAPQFTLLDNNREECDESDYENESDSSCVSENNSSDNDSDSESDANESVIVQNEIKSYTTSKFYGSSSGHTRRYSAPFSVDRPKQTRRKRGALGALSRGTRLKRTLKKNTGAAWGQASLNQTSKAIKKKKHV